MIRIESTFGKSNKKAHGRGNDFEFLSRTWELQNKAEIKNVRPSIRQCTNATEYEDSSEECHGITNETEVEVKVETENEIEHECDYTTHTIDENIIFYDEEECNDEKRVHTKMKTRRRSGQRTRCGGRMGHVFSTTNNTHESPQMNDSRRSVRNRGTLWMENSENVTMNIENVIEKVTTKINAVTDKLSNFIVNNFNIAFIA